YTTLFRSVAVAVLPACGFGLKRGNPHWPCPPNNLHALTGLNGHIGFLGNHPGLAAIQTDRNFQPPFALNTLFYRIACQATQQGTTHSRQNFTAPAPNGTGRSEERRVGKECRPLGARER